MPSQQTLVSFREGLKILQQADDFTTLRETIDTLVSICPPKELHLAKDAIARVIRLKQSKEATKFQAYPQALEEVDKKYRDLYIVLRTSSSKVEVPILHDTPPHSSTSTTPVSQQNQMAKTSPLGGFNLPTLLQWLSNKRKYLLTGGALASTVGGAYWLYTHLNSDKKVKAKEAPEKVSTLDKTIRSIQKYKAFTQMVNDPDFSGNYAELLSGKPSTSKKRKNTKKIKEERPKSNEWDRDEKSLMNDMDTAFNSLGLRPQLNYKLPQLPAPKNIDPRDIVGDSEVLSLKPSKTSERKKTRKTRKPRKPRKTKAVEQVEEISEPTISFPAAAPEKTRRGRKPRKEKSGEQKASKKINAAPGRLIPIIKRTKRVKKVNN